MRSAIQLSQNPDTLIGRLSLTVDFQKEAGTHYGGMSDRGRPGTSRARMAFAHTDPRQWAQWTGLKLDEGPAGSLQPGDHLILSKLGMRIRIRVLGASPLQRFDVHVQLPLGIVNEERIQLTVLGPEACRVTFN